MKRTVGLDKTFPWEVKTIAESDSGPALNPDLILPGQEEEEKDRFQTSNSKSANYVNLKNGIGVKCRNGWVREWFQHFNCRI